MLLLLGICPLISTRDGSIYCLHFVRIGIDDAQNIYGGFYCKSGVFLLQ